MAIERILLITIGTLAFAGILYFAVKMLFHSYHVVTNITGKHASLIGPFVLLSESQFNAKGNRHGLALGTTLLGLTACWAVALAVGMVPPP